MNWIRNAPVNPLLQSHSIAATLTPASPNGEAALQPLRRGKLLSLSTLWRRLQVCFPQVADPATS